MAHSFKSSHFTFSSVFAWEQKPWDIENTTFSCNHILINLHYAHVYGNTCTFTMSERIVFLIEAVWLQSSAASQSWKTEDLTDLRRVGCAFSHQICWNYIHLLAFLRQWLLINNWAKGKNYIILRESSSCLPLSQMTRDKWQMVDLGSHSLSKMADDSNFQIEELPSLARSHSEIFYKFIRPCIAELIGSMCFVFVDVCSVVWAPFAAFTHGFILFVLVAVTASVRYDASK